MRAGVSATALGLGILVVATLLALTPAVQRWNGDVPLFEHYAGLTFSGYLGQTAFLSWYPPLALVPLGLPLMAGTGPAYVLALAAEMAVVTSAGLLLIHRFRDRFGAPARAAVLYTVLALASTAIIAWRYDIVPSVVTLGALVALTHHRWMSAGALVGIGAGLKIYAVVLAPIFILWAWRRGGGMDALRVAVGIGAAGLVAIGAYLLFPGSSPLDLLAFTSARPLHVESLPGAIIALATSLGGGAVSIAYGSGSFNLDPTASGPAIDILRIAQPVVLGASLSIAGLAIWRERMGGSVLVVACTAVLLALVITNRVVSPQYVLWLLPFAALIHGWPRWLMTAGVVVTSLVFPWLSSALIAGEAGPLALVVVRNGLLVAAWVASVGLLVKSTWKPGMAQMPTQASPPGP